MTSLGPSPRRGTTLIPDRNLEGIVSLQATVGEDIKSIDKEIKAGAKAWADAKRENPGLKKARKALHPLAEQCRDLTKELDLAAKLTGRVIDAAMKELKANDTDSWSDADINRTRKSLEAARAEAVVSLQKPRYFIKQADWLQERFPYAELREVEGLVKLVKRAEIKSHDWTLTPGRYVGVAPEKVNEDFDFEEALRSIHVDLKGLNDEAAELAARIAKNFEELGV